jgi:hypothetical protein
VVLSIGKLVFDVALTSWVSEHVPVNGRGRVFGIIETSSGELDNIRREIIAMRALTDRPVFAATAKIYS